VLSEQEQRALLRTLDNPRYLEYPRGFRRRVARAKFDELVGLLNRAFDCVSEVDGHVEDASFHARVTVPAEATESGECITVTISNFGEMAAPALGVPGSYGAEEVEILFHPQDRARVEGALRELGYVVVSEPLLWAGYDGASMLNRCGEYPTTWWHRFFDYL
jgi:hypothetical protein